MRIVVVTTSYPSFDGDPSGHFVEAEVRELERLGHRVEVLRPPAGGAFGWPGAAARLRAHPTRLLEASSWMATASRALGHGRTDQVIAHWSVPSAYPVVTGPFGRDASPEAELEVVSHGGDVRLLCALPDGLRSRVVRQVAARAARWRFVSDDLRAALGGVLSAADERALGAISVVVPGALDVPDVSDVRVNATEKRLAVGDRRLYVCAGRLVPAKRVDKVIDYVATSSAMRDRKSRVLVVLGDGPERDQLEKQARAWQMDVRFLGTTTRREALGWIGAADELVHASKAEGLSTVVREAGILGTAVTLLA